MKIQTRIKRYAWLALGVAALLPVSCIKDDYAGRESGQTTLTLTVTTRSDDPEQDDNDGKTLDAKEEMKTLRVIVARNENNEIIYNWYEDNIADDDFQRTINFSELITIEESGETFDFYAIANEASLDLSHAGIMNLQGKNVNLTALRQCIINRNYNVLADGNIPQTAFASKSVVPNTSDELSMQLKFVVAKVYVGFVNLTGAEQTITSLQLLDSNPKQGYLFDLDEGRIPGNISDYENVSIANGITVVANADEDPSGEYAYLYPGNSTEENAYVLQGMWNGTLKRVDVKTLAGEALASGLQRGQQLNVMITLLGGEHEYTVNCQVNAWGEKVMTIPPFE